MRIQPVSCSTCASTSPILATPSLTTADATTDTGASTLAPASTIPQSFGAPSANQAFQLQAFLQTTQSQFAIDTNGFHARGYVQTLDFTLSLGGNQPAQADGQSSQSGIQRLEDRVNRLFDRLMKRFSDQLSPAMKDMEFPLFIIYS